MASHSPLTVRVPQALVARLDALVPLLTDEPELATKSTITRSDALRLCVLRGLDVLEREHTSDKGMG